MSGLGLHMFDDLGMLNMWKNEIESWSNADIINAKIKSGILKAGTPITDLSILKENGLIFSAGQVIDDQLIMQNYPHIGLQWSLQYGNPYLISMGINIIASICYIRLIVPSDGYSDFDIAQYSTLIMNKCQNGYTLYDEDSGSSGTIIKCYREPMVRLTDCNLSEARIVIFWESKVANKIRTN